MRWDSELEICPTSNWDGSHASIYIYITKCHVFFHSLVTALGI